MSLINTYNYNLLAAAYSSAPKCCEFMVQNSSDLIAYRQAAQTLISLGYIKPADEEFLGPVIGLPPVFRYFITDAGIQHFLREGDKKS